MTTQDSPRARFKRAIDRRALWLAEDAAREMGELSLAEAHQLVHLYADRGSPKFEAAAMRWLRRYLDEAEPSLERFAATAAELARLGAR